MRPRWVWLPATLRLEVFDVDFQFQNQHALMTVQQTFERGAVEAEMQRSGIGSPVAAAPRAQRRFGASPIRLCSGWPISSAPACQQGLDVGADLNDVQRRLAQGQQHAMGLDGTRKADRFVGTVGQQFFKGFLVLRVHASTSRLSSQRSKQLNVDWAAATTASRSSALGDCPGNQ
jgi:hypothetical protein